MTIVTFETSKHFALLLSDGHNFNYGRSYKDPKWQPDLSPIVVYELATIMIQMYLLYFFNYIKEIKSHKL